MVKRFEVFPQDLYPSEEGDLVLFEDYADLQDQLVEVTLNAEKYGEKSVQLADQVIVLQEKLDAAEAKLAELGATQPDHIIAVRFMDDRKQLKPFCVEDMDEAKRWMQENTQGGYVAMSYLAPRPVTNSAEGDGR